MDLRADTEADCYSAGERSAMRWGRSLRRRCCAPLLRALTACGVTGDHLTIAGLLVGLAFVPLYFYWKPAAFCALAVHVLLDGLDGPLARHAGAASRRGSLTDTMCDQLVVTATTLALMAAHAVDVMAGGVYIFLYTVVVVFAMVRNVLQIPYTWLIRPRLIVFAWLPIEAYLLPGTIDYVFWAFNLLLAAKTATGFLRIRQRM
jgi:phosphatidylglycerophosphate synthase